jgi:hypothetical protein
MYDRDYHGCFARPFEPARGAKDGTTIGDNLRQTGGARVALAERVNDFETAGVVI